MKQQRNGLIIEYDPDSSDHFVFEKGVRVLCGGCFDVLHEGHIRFLEAAKNQGEILIIMLESDEFIHNAKKRQPINSQSARAYALSALRSVDYVLLLPYLKTDSQYFQLVTRIEPQIIAVTDGDSNMSKKQDQASRINAKVQIVTPVISQLSSSKIRNHESFSGSQNTI